MILSLSQAAHLFTNRLSTNRLSRPLQQEPVGNPLRQGFALPERCEWEILYANAA